MSSWTDSNADPVGDIQAWAKLVADDCGLYPTRIFMSMTTYESIDRYSKWREQTEMILDGLPRWRFLARMVLKRQLYGSLRKRYRPRWWYRLREWYRERTGWYDQWPDA